MIELELLKLMHKAEKKKQVPIAAIIVKDNKIISKAHNKRFKNIDVMGHAEIIAIKKASKKLKDWRLTNCELYTTTKPCSMCQEIINNSRIKKVIYYLESSDKNTFSSKKEHRNSEYTKEYEKIIKTFFKSMRK